MVKIKHIPSKTSYKNKINFHGFPRDHYIAHPLGETAFFNLMSRAKPTKKKGPHWLVHCDVTAGTQTIMRVNEHESTSSKQSSIFQVLSTTKAALTMKTWWWERMSRILELELNSLNPWRRKKQARKLARRTSTTWWISSTKQTLTTILTHSKFCAALISQSHIMLRGVPLDQQTQCKCTDHLMQDTVVSIFTEHCSSSRCPVPWLLKWFQDSQSCALGFVHVARCVFRWSLMTYRLMEATVYIPRYLYMGLF